MSTLAISMQTTSASFALGDEWDGVSAMMPEAADQAGGYQVPKTFAKVGPQGAVGMYAEALVMGAGVTGGTSKLYGWDNASYPQLNAAMMAAGSAALQRKRLVPDNILLTAGNDRADAALAWDALSLRSAGYKAPLYVPRSAAYAAAKTLGDAPIAVVEIGFEDVLLSEVRYDGTSIDCGAITRKRGLGFSSIWLPLYKQLEDRFTTIHSNTEQARCESLQYARTLFAHALNARAAIASLQHLHLQGEALQMDSIFTCGLKNHIERWCKDIADAIASDLDSYRQAVVAIEDCGIASLAPAVTTMLQPHLTCNLSQGIDAAQGAARLTTSGIQFESLSQRYARLQDFRDYSFGVMRPDGSGGTKFHALGEVPQLIAPQKFSLKTTREDQARMVLPIGICAANAEPKLLGILEFSLSAPAKKGVLVEFYIELADPLIRVCGVEEQNVSPVGEIFVPLDPSLAEEATKFREFVVNMGAVY